MSKTAGKTFAGQSQLPKLPIPPLEETCAKYLKALEALQDPEEHAATKKAVEEFLTGDGPRAQVMLKEYAKDKDRCVGDGSFVECNADDGGAVLAISRSSGTCHALSN